MMGSLSMSLTGVTSMPFSKDPITLIKHAYTSFLATSTAIHFIWSKIRGVGENNSKKEKKNTHTNTMTPLMSYRYS